MRRDLVIQASRPARCDAQVLWARIVDPSTWPEWQPEIDSIEGPPLLRPGDAVEGDAHLLGFSVSGRSAVTSIDGNVFAEDVMVGVRMRIVYRVEQTPTGATVTQRIEATLPRGPAGSLLNVLMRWRLRRMQKEALRRLVAQSEGGTG